MPTSLRTALNLNFRSITCRTGCSFKGYSHFWRRRLRFVSQRLGMVELRLISRPSQATGHTSRVVNLSSFAHNFVSHLLPCQRSSPSQPTVRLFLAPNSPFSRLTLAQISVFPFASPSFASLEDVNRSFEPTGWIRYSQAKLSAILFSRELNKRVKVSRRSRRSTLAYC